MRDFQKPGRSAVFAANGLCATSHPLASATAIRILQDGGNAVDAAIAGAVLLGICEPQMTGIGGDCFVLVKPPGSEEIIALNGSGRAPAGLDAADLRASWPDRDPAARARGCHPARRGRRLLPPVNADYGRSAFADILAPAIRYAEEGIPVAPRVAFDWAERSTRPQGRRARFLLPRRRGPPLGPDLPRARPGRGAAPHRRARAAPGSTKARWPKT